MNNLMNKALKKTGLLTIIIAIFFLAACGVLQSTSSETELWNVNSLHVINGKSAHMQGNPAVVDGSLGKVVRFDGDGDRLLVDANPLGDATEFTIEIIFKPADAYPNNLEPRFFHIESADNPSRRVTIELRLNDKRQWYLDAYIKSEQSQFTLIDSSKVHPIGEWSHAAVTYQNREFISYVNGQKELTGQVDYLPIAADAKTSIGARMNQVHWYKGEVAKVRISKKVLKPEEFLTVEKL